jgi:hypothetical protein
MVKPRACWNGQCTLTSTARAPRQKTFSEFNFGHVICLWHSAHALTASILATPRTRLLQDFSVPLWFWYISPLSCEMTNSFRITRNWDDRHKPISTINHNCQKRLMEGLHPKIILGASVSGSVNLSGVQGWTKRGSSCPLCPFCLVTFAFFLSRTVSRGQPRDKMDKSVTKVTKDWTRFK